VLNTLVVSFPTAIAIRDATHQGVAKGRAVLVKDLLEGRIGRAIQSAHREPYQVLSRLSHELANGAECKRPFDGCTSWRRSPDNAVKSAVCAAFRRRFNCPNASISSHGLSRPGRCGEVSS
jgi:hypothetical protein